jgi:NAD(P)H-flavin reductase
LYVRGPLGHGFSLPPSARKIALAALDCSPRTLLSLLKPALRQEASVTLVGESIPDDLPLQVEAQPAGSLLDICRWADFVAFDVSRASLPQLRLLFQADRTSLKAEAQVLVRTPLPCAALAACGVCTVEVGGEALLACEEGPVFDLHQVMGWSSRA